MPPRAYRGRGNRRHEEADHPYYRGEEVREPELYLILPLVARRNLVDALLRASRLYRVYSGVRAGNK